MIIDELREKYGDATVLGVASGHVEGKLKEGFTAAKDADGLEEALAAHLEPRLRCEAELDPSFKQVIPYLVLSHGPSGRTFATLRTGGGQPGAGRAYG